MGSSHRESWDSKSDSFCVLTCWPTLKPRSLVEFLTTFCQTQMRLPTKDLRIVGVAAIAPWFRLRLPSCGLGFESQAHHLCFFNLYWNCNKKRTKINKKRPGLAHFLKDLRIVWLVFMRDSIVTTGWRGENYANSFFHKTQIWLGNQSAYYLPSLYRWTWYDSSDNNTYLYDCVLFNECPTEDEVCKFCYTGEVNCLSQSKPFGTLVMGGTSNGGALVRTIEAFVDGLGPYSNVMHVSYQTCVTFKMWSLFYSGKWQCLQFSLQSFKIVL